MEATVIPAVLENPHKRIKQTEMEQLDRTIHKTILKNWDRYDEHEVSGLGTLVPYLLLSHFYSLPAHPYVTSDNVNLTDRDI